MLNIYNQDEQTRNSIVQLPENYAENAGVILRSWLSSFWRKVHEGDDLVRGLQEIRGVRLAQMYLDMLEVLKLQDRNGAPVFHRELWFPIVIRRSTRDRSQENLLEIGSNDMEIGPQPEGSIYGEGTVLKMGKLGAYDKYVTYPVDGSSGIKSIVTSVTDNILNPKMVLESGVDFVFRNSTIIFPKESDPFAEGSSFDVYDVPNDESDDPADIDAETVLWASDVLIDRNYIANHVSYAMGVSAPSTDVAKRIVNAAWDAVTGGPTPENVRKLMAAMLNIPVVQNDEETVIEISRDEDGVQKVRTDKMTYSVCPTAKLRAKVSSGARLCKGELLDESLRIYPFLADPNPAKVETLTGFSVPLEQDIPSVVLDSAMIRAKTEFGVYALWGEQPKKYDPVTNKPYFDIGGSEDDVKAFWNDVWSRTDADTLEEIMGPGPISPAKFFLRNLVGANTMFVVVDRDQLDDVSLMREPMFFDMLSRVVPSATRLFLVEHRSASGEDVSDLGSAGEQALLSANIGGAVDEYEPAEDSVLIRFVRPAPAHVNHRKEEE